MTLRGQAKAGHVLVVEDDADIRASVSDLLEEEGYSVSAASNGEEALQILRGGVSPDLILLDLMLPVMDGWQFRVEQRKDPNLASLPVIALTANPTAQAAAIDADRFLRKPFDREALLKAVREVKNAVDAERLAQTERLASLGRLASGVAHEINNPLAYVMANLSMLQKRLLPLLKENKDVLKPIDGRSPASLQEEITDYEDMVLEAIQGLEKIEAIVRDIKVFASFREEKPDALDVNVVMDQALKIAAHRIRHRGRLVKEYGQSVRVMAYAGRLEQVFLNLLLNAVDALPEGDVERNVIRARTYTSADRVIVEVSDTGSGIAPEVLNRIFEPFFTTKPVGTGTGLGLFVCHGIVTALGGTIAVESRPGGGSTFRVDLPSHAGTAGATGRELTPPPPVAPARILVIDDDASVARGIARELGTQHQVSVLTSGREALDLLIRGEQFDLILCDLHMPETTGMDIWEEIRRLRPGTEQKLIFMTAGVFSERALQFAKSVGNAILEKPLNPLRIREIIFRLQQSKRS